MKISFFNIISLLFITSPFFLLSSCAKKNYSHEYKKAVTSRQLVNAYLIRGDYPSALKELLNASFLNSEDEVTQNYLGLTYLGLVKSDLALSYFKKALILKPDYSSARNNLGFTYLSLKKWDETIKCLMEVAKDLLYSYPNYPLNNMVRAYFNKKIGS